MNLTIASCTILAAAVFGYAPPTFAWNSGPCQPEAQPMVAADAHLQETISDALAIINPDSIPRIEVGILQGSVRSVYSLGMDETPGSPRKNDLYHAASLTKVITAWRIAQLAATREIDLDDPAIDGNSATWRQLTTHTSGLPVLPASFTGVSSCTRDEIIEGLSQRDAESERRRFQYSTMGYAVLGLALEDVDQRSFAQQIQEEVLDPIGMSDAHFRIRQEDVAGRYVVGHDRKNEPVSIQRRSSVLDSSGGLYLSVSDMLSFLERMMHPAQDGEDASSYALAVHDDIRSFPGSVAGLGWHFMPDAGFYWHAGNGPGHHSFVVFHPETRIGVVILTNRAVAQSDPRLAIASFQLLGSLVEDAKR